jgi:hypothetical protein
MIGKFAAMSGKMRPLRGELPAAIGGRGRPPPFVPLVQLRFLDEVVAMERHRPNGSTLASHRRFQGLR